MIFVILIIALMIGGFFYARYIMSKHREALKDVNWNEEFSKADQHVQNQLNGNYQFLKNWMDGAPIEGFSSAKRKLSTAEQAQAIAVDGAKKLAARAVGVRLRNVETPTYVTVSDGSLHLIDTNLDGEKSSHLIFGPDRLSRGKMEKKVQESNALTNAWAGAKDSKELNTTNYILSLDIDGKPFNLEIFPQVLPYSGGFGSFASNFKEGVSNRAAGHKLIEELQKRYPNLTTPV